MKKNFEEPKLDVIRFAMKECITWGEAGSEDFDFGTMTSEGVEEW